MKSKFETNILPNISKIEKWAAEGATAKEISKKLKIAYSTLRKYIDAGNAGDERYAALADAFTRGCVISDDNVENALYRRACGIEFVEVKQEQKVNPKTGEIDVLTTKTTKYVPPDPTSAMFWLANRRPERWKYKPDESGDDEGGESGVVLLPPVMDNPGPPAEAAEEKVIL